jgi:hypothetical protein
LKPGEGVKVKLDRERTLRFDMNAQVAFEEVTGENTLDGTFLKKKVTAKLTRALMWSCLIHEDPTLTIEQVGALLTPKNAAGLSASLKQALADSVPEGEGDAEEDDGKNVDLPTG